MKIPSDIFLWHRTCNKVNQKNNILKSIDILPGVGGSQLIFWMGAGGELTGKSAMRLG